MKYKSKWSLSIVDVMQVIFAAQLTISYSSGSGAISANGRCNRCNHSKNQRSHINCCPLLTPRYFPARRFPFQTQFTFNLWRGIASFHLRFSHHSTSTAATHQVQPTRWLQRVWGWRLPFCSTTSFALLSLFFCSMFSLLWMKARSPHCWEVHLSIGLGHLQYHNIACHSCCHLLSPSQAWVEFCSYVRFSRLTCWVALWQQGEKANVLSTHVLQRTRPNRAGCSMPKIYNQHQQCIPGLIRSSLHFLVWG